MNARTVILAGLLVGGSLPSAAVLAHGSQTLVCHSHPWTTYPAPYGGGSHCYVGDGHANPLPTGPLGRKCGFNSATDVTREAGWQIGDINAGPLVTAEGGTLVCTVHVNNNDHNGAALVTELATAVAGVAAVMEPRELRYQATAADTVSLCTEWRGDSGTLYWHSPNPAIPTDLGSWDTNPTNCGEALVIHTEAAAPCPDPITVKVGGTCRFSTGFGTVVTEVKSTNGTVASAREDNRAGGGGFVITGKRADRVMLTYRYLDSDGQEKHGSVDVVVE